MEERVWTKHYFSVHFTTDIGDVKLSTNVVYGRNGLWVLSNKTVVALHILGCILRTPYNSNKRNKNKILFYNAISLNAVYSYLGLLADHTHSAGWQKLNKVENYTWNKLENFTRDFKNFRSACPMPRRLAPYPVLAAALGPEIVLT